jgi:protoporphyrinogen oxidase
MKKKIAIIGAGISGLSLGYFLSKKNFDVIVFEKDKETGGLLNAIKSLDNFNIEKFYHHIFPFDKDFLNLVKEIGLFKDIKWYKSSNSVFVNNKFYPFSGVIDYFKFPNLNLLQKLRLLVGGYIFSKKKLNDIENKKASSVISKYMGSASWEKLWQPLFEKKFGKDTDNILASWFWWRMNVKLGQKRKEILGYPKGGFAKFLNYLEVLIIKKGGKIVKNCNISKVVKDKDYYLVNEDKFNKAFFTIPNIEVNKIYKNANLKEREYKAAINVILILSKKQTKCYWNNILDKEIPFVGIIEHTNLVNDNYYKNKSVIYLTQYLDNKDPLFSKSDKEIFYEYKKYFNKVGINKEDIERYFVSKSKYAQPVLRNKPEKIGYEKIDNNSYTISMEHIYPEDRGINQAVKYAKKLADNIS